jgi:hypothetical protein
MTRPPSDHSASKAKPAPAPAQSKVSTPKATPRKRSSHSKLIIPFLSAGLLVGGAVLLIRERMHRPYTASMVKRDLRDLALQRGVSPGQPDGGELGPWWISATSFDPMSGELKNFRLKSGSIELAALTAKILVDPEADSIGFDLFRLVYTVLPNDTHPERAGELIELNKYTLGPVPFGREIVPDAGGATSLPIRPETVPAAEPPPPPPIASVTN